MSVPNTLQQGGLSSGSTLLNLACSDHPLYAFFAGGYYYLVGDSSSGKTFTTLTCFAEAMRNKEFKDYRLIFDDVEGGALMDIEFFFGKKVNDRMEAPSYRHKKPVYSTTIESFYRHLHDAIDHGEPFIYVLDSQDALTSEASNKKFQANKTASETGSDGKGSFGDGKAKYHSENLRHVLRGLRKTKSILIIVGQTRDNLGFSFDKKTRSGGKSLRFYANIEIWTSSIGKLKKKVRGKDRTLGNKCLAEVRKNRITGKIGKDRAVEIPIYYAYGIDDIGSCIDFLVTNDHWKRDSETKEIDAKELMTSATRGALVKCIEEEELQVKLRETVGKVWLQIEAESAPQRKRRYE